MEVKELRIGNFVQCPKGNIEIITDLDSLKNINGMNPSYFRPIQITEEWLVKFGFEWYAQVKPNGYWMNGFCIEKLDSMLINYNTGVGLKYVHKLQNLYFALTGQELTINE